VELVPILVLQTISLQDLVQEDNVLEFVLLDLLIAIITNFLMDVKSTLKLIPTIVVLVLPDVLEPISLLEPVVEDNVLELVLLDLLIATATNDLMDVKSTC
jgi:hypothetical protein